jgi:hypothetical protein
MVKETRATQKYNKTLKKIHLYKKLRKYFHPSKMMGTLKRTQRNSYMTS